MDFAKNEWCTAHLGCVSVCVFDCVEYTQFAPSRPFIIGLGIIYDFHRIVWAVTHKVDKIKLFDSLHFSPINIMFIYLNLMKASQSACCFSEKCEQKMRKLFWLVSVNISNWMRKTNISEWMIECVIWDRTVWSGNVMWHTAYLQFVIAVKYCGTHYTIYSQWSCN